MPKTKDPDMEQFEKDLLQSIDLEFNFVDTPDTGPAAVQTPQRWNRAVAFSDEGRIEAGFLEMTIHVDREDELEGVTNFRSRPRLAAYRPERIRQKAAEQLAQAAPRGHLWLVHVDDAGHERMHGAVVGVVAFH